MIFFLLFPPTVGIKICLSELDGKETVEELICKAVNTVQQNHRRTENQTRQDRTKRDLNTTICTKNTLYTLYTVFTNNKQATKTEVNTPDAHCLFIF